MRPFTLYTVRVCLHKIEPDAAAHLCWEGHLTSWMSWMIEISEGILHEMVYIQSAH